MSTSTIQLANLPADAIWERIQDETQREAQCEPVLASFLHASIMNHSNLESALSFHLANKLQSPDAPALLMRDVVQEALSSDSNIRRAVRADLLAVEQRDSACERLLEPFLYYKGFHALEAYRISHWLWQQKRESLALFIQNRISVEFGVDIHPAAKIGEGILFDHATGIVVGETAVVGNNVSIMQAVTLGGTGKESGDRHPKVGDGVLLSAGAKILGNINIGTGAKVGAGSVVLKDIPAHTTAAGVPAEIIGRPCSEQPALEMDHGIKDDIATREKE